MVTFITVIHVIVCIFLILVVLLQAGKGGGMGLAFGSQTSSQVFGGRGAGSFLERLTAGTAIVFMLTSMTLAYFASQSDSARLQKRDREQKKQAEAADKKAAEKKVQDEAAERAKTQVPLPSGSTTPAPTGSIPAPTGSAPAPTTPAPATPAAPAPKAPPAANTAPAPSPSK